MTKPRLSSKQEAIKILAETVLNNPYLKGIPVNDRTGNNKLLPTQLEFITCPEYECLIGGAKGGGKSHALLIAALQYVQIPQYRGLIIRRTIGELKSGLFDIAANWLKDTDAEINVKDLCFRFPNGARLSFGYLDNEQHLKRYQGSELQFLGFDELTQFPEKWYTEMKMSLRSSTKQLTPRVRATTNPKGDGELWVHQRFVAEDAKEKYKTRFINSSFLDNPALDRDAYKKTLSHLSEREFRQLAEGEWLVADDGLFPLNLLEKQSSNTTLWRGGEYSDNRTERQLFVGVDPGITDLFCTATIETINNVRYVREVFTKTFNRKSMSKFPEMTQDIEQRLNRMVLKCLIDKGSYAMPISDDLSLRYPCVEGFSWTQTTGARLANQLAAAMQKGLVVIPNDPQIIDDFRNVPIPGRAGGKDVWRTIKRNRDGHGDRFVAIALAYEASRMLEDDESTSMPVSVAANHSIRPYQPQRGKTFILR